MAFTAMVGKELLQLNYGSGEPGKTILSTYVAPNCDETASESAATDGDDDSFKDAISEEEKEGVAEMKTTRPSMGMLEDDPDSIRSVPLPMNGHVDKPKAAAKEEKRHDSEAEEAGYQTPDEDKTTETSEPRTRFRDSLSALQIEEAKETGKAQLGLAFAMLTMMKKRALKADPEAYQCLIDACGRVGDTNRATDLLAKMHEDGIVADGTVYACLVSAFSADTAWKNGTREEDLPGKKLTTVFSCNTFL
jgi:pentatricopeptide repeat protein